MRRNWKWDLEPQPEPRPEPLLTIVPRDKPGTEAWNCAKTLSKIFNAAGFPAYLIPPAKSEDKALHVRVPTNAKSLIFSSTHSKHYLDFKIQSCDVYSNTDRLHSTGHMVQATQTEQYTWGGSQIPLKNMPDEKHPANIWLQGDAFDRTQQVGDLYVKLLKKPGFV